MERRPHTPEWADRMNAAMTLEQAIRTHDMALDAAGRTAGTRVGYMIAYDRFLAYLIAQGIAVPTIADLTPEHVRNWTLALRSGQTVNERNGTVRSRGPRTLQSHVGAIKGLAHFLVNESVLTADPLASVKLPRVPKKLVDPFSPEEIRRLFDAISLRGMATRNRAMLYFLLATGARASELCSLGLADLDLKAGTARLWGKGSKERIARFDKLTGRYLALYLAERPDGARTKGRVFVSQRGVPMTRSALFKVISAIAGDAHVDGAHPHRMRHTFAVTWLRVHPGAVFHLQELLGHSSLEMTKRYVRLASMSEEMPGPEVIETLGLNGRRH